MEDQEGPRRGQEGLGEVQKHLEEVGKAVGESRRGGKAQEGNAMLHLHKLVSACHTTVTASDAVKDLEGKR